MVLAGSLTPTALLAAAYMVKNGARRFGLAIPQLRAVQNARFAAAEIFSIIDRVSEEAGFVFDSCSDLCIMCAVQVPAFDSLSDDGDRLADVDGRIEFKHLRFAYPGRPNVEVLHDVNFTIAAGENVALVGESGKLT